MATQSIIDPFTDTIQIIGRFRNGIVSASHITNTDYKFQVRSKAQLQFRINVFEENYKMLKAYYDNATSEELRDAVKAILNKSSAHSFIKHGWNKELV